MTSTIVTLEKSTFEMTMPPTIMMTKSSGLTHLKILRKRLNGDFFFSSLSGVSDVSGIGIGCGLFACFLWLIRYFSLPFLDENRLKLSLRLNSIRECPSKSKSIQDSFRFYPHISFRSGGTACICKDGLLSVIHPKDHSLLTRSTGLSFRS